jgi:hypothetical protein
MRTLYDGTNHAQHLQDRYVSPLHEYIFVYPLHVSISQDYWMDLHPLEI